MHEKIFSSSFKLRQGLLFFGRCDSTDIDTPILKFKGAVVNLFVFYSDGGVVIE